MNTLRLMIAACMVVCLCGFTADANAQASYTRNDGQNSAEYAAAKAKERNDIRVTRVPSERRFDPKYAPRYNVNVNVWYYYPRYRKRYYDYQTRIWYWNTPYAGY